MIGIERDPSAVQRPGRLDLATSHFLENDLARNFLAAALGRRAANIAVAFGLLDLRHLGQRAIENRRHFRISGVGHRETAGRQPMAQGVAGDARAFPAAVAWLVGLQPRRPVEIVQQPLWIQGQEVAAIGGHGVAEGRRRETHVPCGNRFDPAVRGHRQARRTDEGRR